jgi:hypothetical protein
MDLGRVLSEENWMCLDTPSPPTKSEEITQKKQTFHALDFQDDRLKPRSFSYLHKEIPSCATLTPDFFNKSKTPLFSSLEKSDDEFINVTFSSEISTLKNTTEVLFTEEDLLLTEDDLLKACEELDKLDKNDLLRVCGDFEEVDSFHSLPPSSLPVFLENTNSSSEAVSLEDAPEVLHPKKSYHKWSHKEDAFILKVFEDCKPGSFLSKTAACKYISDQLPHQPRVSATIGHLNKLLNKSPQKRKADVAEESNFKRRPWLL